MREPRQVGVSTFAKSARSKTIDTMPCNATDDRNDTLTAGQRASLGSLRGQTTKREHPKPGHSGHVANS